MGRKAALAMLAVALLLARGLPPAASSDDARDICRLPQPAPVHWLRPVGGRPGGEDFAAARVAPRPGATP